MSLDPSTPTDLEAALAAVIRPLVAMAVSNPELIAELRNLPSNS